MSKLSKRLPDDYTVLLSEVKKRVLATQYEALKAVNKELVVRRILELEQHLFFKAPI